MREMYVSDFKEQIMQVVMKGDNQVCVHPYLMVCDCIYVCVWPFRA